MHYAKYGNDTYQFYEDAASTTRAFGFAWIVRVSFDARPMWPNEFHWSLLYKSGIVFSLVPMTLDRSCYYHIKDSRQPFT